ncbi:MAG TPA: hypothetical protein VMI74_08740 [Burkholderiales bacterium]|nr:hypothetical protein [Burkholderiales bacterium]
MSNRETKPGMFTLTLLAVVICAVAILLMPAQAGTEESAAAAIAVSDYLPARIENQAREIVPEPVMYY